MAVSNSTNTNGIVPIPSSSLPTQVRYNALSQQSQQHQHQQHQHHLQQPQTHPIAHFASTPPPNPTSNLLSVNSSYILYSVKNGLVRVIDRQSSLRTLLRGHSTRISDSSFFQGHNAPGSGTSHHPSNTSHSNTSHNNTINNTINNNNNNTINNNSSSSSSDVVGTVSYQDPTSNVIIWRIIKRESELVNEKLLEIRLKSAIRLIWHLFNPNQFILLHGPGPDGPTRDGASTAEGATTTPHAAAAAAKKYHIIATFVETTRLMTVQHPTDLHAVCTSNQKTDEIDGGGTLKFVVFDNENDNDNGNENGNENDDDDCHKSVYAHDLIWSTQDSRHVLTSHQDGYVRLWDIRTRVYYNTTTGQELDLNDINNNNMNANNGKDGASSTANANGNANSTADGGENMNMNMNMIESAKCILKLKVTNSTGLDQHVQKCFFLQNYDDASAMFTPNGTTALEPGSYLTKPFVTVTKQGSCVTLWSPFTTSASPPKIVRIFELESDVNVNNVKSTYNVSLCTLPKQVYGHTSSTLPQQQPPPPPSSYLLFADKTIGKIYTLHLHSLWRTIPLTNSTTQQIAAVVGYDYIIPFTTVQPIYSWNTLISPSEDDVDVELTETNENSEKRWNIDLFCVQSKGVQLLTLTNRMLSGGSKFVKGLGEGDDLPIGMSVDEIYSFHAGVENNDEDDDDDDDDEVVSFESEEYEVEDQDIGDDEEDDDEKDDDIEFENYDQEDDDDDEDISEEEDAEALEDVPLPPIPNFFSGGGSNDDSNTNATATFSNWLGNLAATPSTIPTTANNGTTTNTNTNTNKSTKKLENNIIPPTPHPTPAAPLRTTIDLANVPLPSVPDVALADLPLPEETPTAPTTNTSTTGSSNLQSQESKVTTTTTTTTATKSTITTAIPSKPNGPQRYLSPTEFLQSSSKKDDKGVTGVKTPSRMDITSNAKVTSSSGGGKSDKKESKKKSNQNKSSSSKMTQPVPIPSKDGKIAILKREDSAVAVAGVTGGVASKKGMDSDIIRASTSMPIKARSSTAAAAAYVGVTKEEVEDIVKRAVSGHFQKQENGITAEIQKAVRYEVQSGLVPTLNKTVSQTLDQTIATTMKSSVSKSVKEGTKINTDELSTAIASKLQDPLVDAFYKSMRELMIPAYESGTREMFQQISTSIEKGLDLKEKEENENAKAMEAMMKRMDAMAKTMEVLIQGVAKVTASGAAAAPTKEVKAEPPTMDKIEMLKGKIMEYLMAKDYERAFTHALSASNPDVAVWTCKKVDLSIVVESETPKLSQPIMLCLMQQLGAEFSPQKDGDMQLKLAWLQSIALTLDPNNDSIKTHVGSVCQHLVTNLQAKIAEPNVVLRREMQMVLQVVRGIGRS